MSLAFGWPAATRARVEARRHVERYTEGKYDTTGGTITYRMIAERSDKDYVLRFSDFRIPSLPADTNHDAETIAMLSALLPGYRVSLSGEFVGLESPDSVQARFRQLARSWMSAPDSLSGKGAEMMDHVTSAEVLAALAAEDWNEIVGTWIDTKIEIGALYELESVEPYPIFQGAEVLMRYRFQAVRRTPCDLVKAPALSDCVELRMTSNPDSAALRQLIDTFLREVSPDVTTEGQLTSMSLLTEVTLIARPENLLPIQVTRVKRASGTMTIGTDKLDSFSNVETRVRRFTYEQ